MQQYHCRAVGGPGFADLEFEVAAAVGVHGCLRCDVAVRVDEPSAPILPSRPDDRKDRHVCEWGSALRTPRCCGGPTLMAHGKDSQ